MVVAPVINSDYRSYFGDIVLVRCLKTGLLGQESLSSVPVDSWRRWCRCTHRNSGLNKFFCDFMTSFCICAQQSFYGQTFFAVNSAMFTSVWIMI